MRLHGAYKAKSSTRNISLGLEGYAESGTWTPITGTTGLPTLTRTSANNTTQYYVIDFRNLYDKLTGRGFYFTSYKVCYTIDAADSGDDVQFWLSSRTLPADNASGVPTTRAGATDANYDSDHDTAAERVLDTGAPQKHTATITVPTASRRFIADDEIYSIVIKVIEANDAAGALALVVKDIIATGIEVL